jgi:hypothetical protein
MIEKGRKEALGLLENRGVRVSADKEKLTRSRSSQNERFGPWTPEHV